MHGAGQDKAEFRCHDMRNALLGITQIENANAVALRALAHGALEMCAIRIGVLVAAGFGGDRMVLHGKGEIRAAHGARGCCELLESMWGVQIVQDVTVNIDEIAAVDPGRDIMRVPDAVEHGPWFLACVHSSCLLPSPCMRWTGARGEVRNLRIESGKIKSKNPRASHVWQKIGEDEC